jgi:hypothetical protein
VKTDVNAGPVSGPAFWRDDNAGATKRVNAMKLTGMLLLLAGWGIVVCAVMMFPAPAPRATFIVAGVAVEILGMVLAFRREAL